MQRSRASFLTFGLAALIFLLAAGNAFAWEWAYGPPNSFEQAFRRVAPVLNCPSQGPGYIAVGTFDQFGGNPEVYVVYTNLAGAPVWEMTYDVQASTYEDEGMAIVEVPGGFVILSNTRKPGSTPWMPALTFIKCHGGVVWSTVYPDVVANQDLRGHDLIRLATGNPAFGTAAGDFAVAGSWFNGANEDAFLMRTTAAGALIWDLTYHAGGVEAFNALTEAGPLTTQPTADIVAVGRFNKINGDLQGLVARVNGDTGAIGAAPQCLAHHGLPATNSQEVYNSVTPLTSPSFFGQFAMIGTSTNPAAYSDDVWITRGNPCAIAAQSRIGNPLGPAPTSEHGNDLREVMGPVIGPAGGVLAIAGDHAPLGAAYDATYLQVATATLLPNGASGRIFGDHAFNDEVFFSLSEDPATGTQGGWVLAGYTQTDWQPIGDPRDLYLVHYNPNSTVSGCEKKWSPGGVQLTWPSNPLNYRRDAPARYYQVHTLETPQWNPWLVCP